MGMRETDLLELKDKTVLASIQGKHCPLITCPKPLNNIINVLLPQYINNGLPNVQINPDEVPEISDEQVLEAAKIIKDNKAPGLDAIPNIATKLAVQIPPKTFVEVFTACLEEGIFLAQWKKQCQYAS